MWRIQSYVSSPTQHVLERRLQSSAFLRSGTQAEDNAAALTRKRGQPRCRGDCWLLERPASPPLPGAAHVGWTLAERCAGVWAQERNGSVKEEKSILRDLRFLKLKNSSWVGFEKCETQEELVRTASQNYELDFKIMTVICLLTGWILALSHGEDNERWFLGHFAVGNITAMGSWEKDKSCKG